MAITFCRFLPPALPGFILEHVPEKACPGLDPGWEPVFGKDHAPTMSRRFRMEGAG
jgi:hypothetical protein